MNIDLAYAVVNWTIVIGLFVWACAQIENFLKFIFQKYKLIFFIYPQKKRDMEFLRKVRKIGCIFAYNEEAGITAVTSLKLLREEIKVERKRLAEKYQVKTNDVYRCLVKPIKVMPADTFTFARQEEGFVFTTGSQHLLEEITSEFLRMRTGFSIKEISWDVWERAEKIIAKKDKRLLVPMVREGHLPNGELMMSLDVQVKTFGHYTPEYATNTMFTY